MEIATDNPRYLAVLALRDIEKNGEYSNIALKRHMSEKLSAADRRLFSALVYTTLTHKLRIDYIISRFCAAGKSSATVRNILRIGVCQICFMDKIPHSAAVNECVNIAKAQAKYAAGFVNSVLRNVSRNCRNIEFPMRDNIIEYLMYEYSYPLWLVEKWLGMYGADFCEKLLAAQNTPPPICIRVNTLKMTAQELAGKIKLTPTAHKNAFFIEGTNIEKEPSYINGELTVMDISSMTACEKAGVRPGMDVLDMCAAPGGKAVYLAELMENRGGITAFDLHPHRVELIRKNAARMEAAIICAECADSSVTRESLRNRFDVVLLDAPCSGLGVIRSKPDIKWKDPVVIPAIVETQKKLITAGAEYVKAGGTLVYCTCTLNRDENEDVVSSLLSKRDDYIIEESTTLFPHIDNTNGFFIARLKKEV